jgi:sec-independent protein translocase protein TatA
MHPPSILQLVLIIILVLLLFGSKRVPEIMENMAKGIKGFKDGLKDEDKKSITDKNKPNE